MTFRRQTVLITGAAVGIGRAAALKFAQNGAQIALVDLDRKKLEAVKEELAKYTDRVLTFTCDVSEEERVNEVVRQVQQSFGQIHILVNNAALWRHKALFEEAAIDIWKQYLDINVMGTVYFTKAVIGQMRENQYGRVINIASVAGVYGNARMVPYSATKGAVIAMTKALAKEVASYGITVNSISPGSVSPSENPNPDYYEDNDQCFMGRTGTNMENASLICFLASRGASYISGQNIQVDGCRMKL